MSVRIQCAKCKAEHPIEEMTLSKNREDMLCPTCVPKDKKRFL